MPYDTLSAALEFPSIERIPTTAIGGYPSSNYKSHIDMQSNILARLVGPVAICFCAHACAQESPSNRALAAQSDTQAAKVRDAALAMQRKSWEQGVLAVAFLEQGDNDRVVQMAKASLIYTSKDGLVAAEGGAPVDPLMIGEALWHAARISNDSALRKAADDMLEWTLKTAPRASDGTIFHRDQTHWSDSFHTSPPFLACAGQCDAALQQIEGHWKRLWDPEKKLLSHRWNEGQNRFDNKRAWGGGNGWAAAGLTRVIRALPAERKADREKLVSHLKALLDGCIAHQRPDGLFHDFVDEPDTFVETNLAQMLAYSIYESVRGGWLNADYLKAADQMRAAARAKVDRNGFVQDVCAAPTFNKPGVSPEGQAFFLMMEAAAGKLAASRK